MGYSPERINPGDKEHHLSKIVKIVSESNDESLMKISKLYSSIISAEFLKLKILKRLRQQK